MVHWLQSKTPLQLSTSCLDDLRNSLYKTHQGHRAEVFFRAQADSNGIVCCLFISDYQHVGHFLKLGVTYLGIHTLAALIHFGTPTDGFESLPHTVGVRQVTVRAR